MFEGQSWRDAAKRDREFGKLPDHMADFYDNEIRAEVRGAQEKKRKCKKETKVETPEKEVQ